MRKISLLVMFGLLALPAMAVAETFSDVPVVDTNCSKKVADAPDSHTRECALKSSTPLRGNHGEEGVVVCMRIVCGVLSLLGNGKQPQ